MSRLTVYVACAASLALGLFFIFVWAPHPWGWEGFDDYHDLGLIVARGESFPTIDRPWGYAYYLATFYRIFGDHPWIPLVGQATLNALLPLLVYALTQAADAVCTVIFMAAVLAFARARRREDWRLHVVAGLLLGIAAQFRPNLILVPLLLA